MIRNKRSDVDIQFTKRKATTYAIEFSDQEKQLYDQISSWIKEQYINEQPVFSRFILKTLQEEMGSTFHAAQHTLHRLAEHPDITKEQQEYLTTFVDQADGLLKEYAHQNAKVQMLLEILEEHKDKVLIFTKYKSTLNFLQGCLEERGYKVAVFHGSLRRQQKEEQISMFREEIPILLSTEAGGEGRNLQFCNVMINYDLPWNPMAIEQRIGRIHRVGQTRDVYIYNLAAKDTLEYYILELLDRKINMFEMVVGEVDLILGEILKKNKEDFIKMKQLDDKLFGQ